MEILPIGTLVKLKNEKNKAMIVSRMPTLEYGDKMYYFDYSGCVYPSGLISTNIINFNYEDIEEIIHKGFVDEIELQEQELMEKWLSETDVKKADKDLIKNIVEENKVMKINQNG